LILLFRYNRYQQSVFFTSAGAVTGKVYEAEGLVNSYLGLRQENENLLRRNMELEQRVAFAEKRYKDMLADSVETLLPIDSVFTTIGARVISNTLNKQDNFITLNKGRLSGIAPDMGVLDAQGVVGIVYKVSDHYSLVISLLNSKMNLSCKVKGTEYFGYLSWEGKESEFAYLNDLPRHAEFTLGDTIITSGFSSVFPEGLLVGNVDDIMDSNDGLSYQIRVKLASNFGSLNHVSVIATSGKEERDALESNADVAVEE